MDEGRRCLQHFPGQLRRRIPDAFRQLRWENRFGRHHPGRYGESGLYRLHGVQLYLSEPDFCGRILPPVRHPRLLPGRPTYGKQRGCPRAGGESPFPWYPGSAGRRIQPYQQPPFPVSGCSAERYGVKLLFLLLPAPGKAQASRSRRASGIYLLLLRCRYAENKHRRPVFKAVFLRRRRLLDTGV